MEKTIDILKNFSKNNFFAILILLFSIHLTLSIFPKETHYLISSWMNDDIKHICSSVNIICTGIISISCTVSVLANGFKSFAFKDYENERQTYPDTYFALLNILCCVTLIKYISIILLYYNQPLWNTSILTTTASYCLLFFIAFSVSDHNTPMNKKECLETLFCVIFGYIVLFQLT